MSVVVLVSAERSSKSGRFGRSIAGKALARRGLGRRRDARDHQEGSKSRRSDYGQSLQVAAVSVAALHVPFATPPSQPISPRPLPSPPPLPSPAVMHARQLFMSRPVGHVVPVNAHTAQVVTSLGQLPFVAGQSPAQFAVVSPASQVPLLLQVTVVPDPDPEPEPFEP